MADHLGALAGLGEVGRQGLLITPEYGPNLRLFTIITDYPFILDRPLVFGVADYCETCQRCINECPARAIGEGRRRPGLYPWPVKRRACFDNWLEKRDPCRKCIEICPYTHEPLVGSPGSQRF
jgi:epoxyqueuosine reductase QueG